MTRKLRSAGNKIIKCTRCGKAAHSDYSGKICKACLAADELANAHDDGDHDDEPSADCLMCQTTKGTQS